MNTAIIYLFQDALDGALDGDQVTVKASTHNGVCLAVRADQTPEPLNPIVELYLDSDEAQALIASLQAALNAHWGNV